jgi:hypothetical protein
LEIFFCTRNHSLYLKIKLKVEEYMRFFVAIFLCLLLLSTAWAQSTPPPAPPPATGALRGQITDPSGAAIPGATVVMTPATGSPIAVQSNDQGAYEFKSLAPGTYTLTVVAQGFSLYENDNVVIAAQALRLNVSMLIEVEQQKVQVSDTAPTVDVNPANNAGAIVISGKELEALPDDPDELLSDLTALAGPSAGPNGGQMYVDGFTAGQLPPKSSIREIRINQNPFSAEYDKLGYGRIEILTKPGTDNYHGSLFVIGNDSAFNSPNPFINNEPGYDTVQYNGNIGGPIGKKASFYFGVDRRNINELAAINGVTLDPSSPDSELTFAESIPNPRQRTNLTPRLDWALSKNNTLTTRYQYYRDTENNNGVGGFSLPSQAYHSTTIEHTLQLSDTQVIGTKVVNETRFQYIRDETMQNPGDSNPTVNVPTSFGGGGSGQGTLNDRQNNYELQNYTSVVHGTHITKLGGRLRATQDTNYSTAGFNASFSFSSLDSSADVLANCANLGSNPACPFSYQSALEAINNHQIPYATSLTYTIGTPTSTVHYVDAGLYVQDDWRIRSNITLSTGLRFETQNAIRDKGDWAPRLGFAWGVGGKSAPPKVVIRGGYGVFYDRFQTSYILQAARLNGVVQQQFIINNPTCFPGLDAPIANLADCGAPTSTTSNTYTISPSLHSPYTAQGAVSVERQVTKSATVSATYLNSRGFDQFLTINRNAPYPGTSCYPSCPSPTGAVAYQYVSEGNFKQNQLILNGNVRIGTKVQMFGFYTFGYANSDTSGISGFASNSYDISQDYGRGSFDVRNRVFLGGSIALPYLIRLSPFIVISSGSPFTITSPLDINGDQIYNNRPSLVSSATCPTSVNPTQGSTIYCTPLGTFDASGAGKIIPINSETGPNHFVMNFRLTKTFGIGPKIKAANNNQNQGGGPPGGGGGGRGGGGPRGPLFGGGGGGFNTSSNSDRRYNLTMGVGVRNAFNNVNVSNPNATLGSRFFDQSNSLQGGPFSQGSSSNRRIELQATFSF